jgi:threonine synthase
LAYDFSLEYSKIKGGMNRNTAYNPMTIEGKKTVSIEIVKDIQTAPDYVFVSTGDGCIVAGVIKGFKDLLTLGLIDKMPVIYSVQAKTSNALYRAYHSGKFDNLPSHTIADSICVDIPRNGYHALKLLKEYNGKIINVSDEEILNAQAELSSNIGLFTEPAGAAAYAGLLSEIKNIDKDSIIVVLTTGNGLKDISTALKKLKEPKIITNINEII